jgi:2-keto-4-pentenoate hydratase/2-oxohepta-3-ene-1,7-dioic acid hydratase in catechol pathway
MISLIEAAPASVDVVRDLAKAANRTPVPLASVRVVSPIPRPRNNIFCVGWNYLEHFAEGERVRQRGQKLPSHPMFFSKTSTTVSGSRERVWTATAPWGRGS